MSLRYQLLTAAAHEVRNSSRYPFVVSIWPFLEAVRAAWTAADSGSTAIDVVEGCAACEELRCDGTETKNQWAHDDPAFVMICSLLLAVSTLAYCAAYDHSFE